MERDTDNMGFWDGPSTKRYIVPLVLVQEGRNTTRRSRPRIEGSAWKRHLAALASWYDDSCRGDRPIYRD